jgi:membrane associated rhomboid family serine protease
MGIFNRGVKLDADGAVPRSKTELGKKATRINGLLAGSLSVFPGSFAGTIIGGAADDINDIYYNGKENPYNSSYDVAGHIGGGIAAALVGRHYGRKATRMLLDGKWTPSNPKFKDFMVTDVTLEGFN